MMSALYTFSAQSAGSTSSIVTETDSSAQFACHDRLRPFLSDPRFLTLRLSRVELYDDVRHRSIFLACGPKQGLIDLHVVRLADCERHYPCEGFGRSEQPPRGREQVHSRALAAVRGV